MRAGTEIYIRATVLDKTDRDGSIAGAAPDWCHDRPDIAWVNMPCNGVDRPMVIDTDSIGRPELRTVIGEALGEASALFMQSEQRGVDQVMPDAALSDIIDDAVARLS